MADSPKWIRLKLVTVNDDFTDRKTNIPLVAPYADVILTQENKDDNVRSLVPKGWSVHQVMKNASTRGSAVCWREGKPFKKGSTDQKFAVGSNGFKLTPRRITVVHGRVGVAPVSLIACHRPPRRMKRLWPIFDAVLASYIRLLKLRGRFVFVGLDFNDRTEKGHVRFARIAGMRAVFPSRSLDGFFVPNGMGVGVHQPKNLPKWHSDHHPVLLWVNIPQRSKV